MEDTAFIFSSQYSAGSAFLVIYLGYLFVLHKKINKIKSFDSRIAVSVKVITFEININYKF